MSWSCHDRFVSHQKDEQLAVEVQPHDGDERGRQDHKWARQDHVPGLVDKVSYGYRIPVTP